MAQTSNNTRRRRRRRRNNIRMLFYPTIAVFLLLLVIVLIKLKTSEPKDTATVIDKNPTTEAVNHNKPEPDTASNNDEPDTPEPTSLSSEEESSIVASLSEDMQKLYTKHPEAKDFVLSYNEEKYKPHDIDLSEYNGTTTVPYLNQWDKRWGYNIYAGDVFGLTGCGPTCLSMASIYLLGDTSLTPKYIGEFSEEHGYSTTTSGTQWTLFSEGGPLLGLEVIELPLAPTPMTTALDQGKLIACIVGPGDFTDGGHYILITGYTSEGFKVNDSNSTVNSEKLWTYDQLAPQIRNLWSLDAQ